MTQYFTDFSDSTPGNTPAGWTATWNHTGSWLYNAGGYVQVDLPSAANSVLYWSDLGSLTDCEILVKFRISTVGGASIIGTTTRLGTAGYVGLFGNDIASCYLTRQNSSSTLATLDFGTPIFPPVNSVDYWIRMQSIGTAHKWRIWEDGDPEPGTWELEATNASYAAGFVGLWARDHVSVTRIYQVGVTDDPATESAPDSAPAPTMDFAGTATGGSSATASIQPFLQQLIGSATGGSAGSGFLAVDKSLAGTAAGGAAASVDLSVPKPLVGAGFGAGAAAAGLNPWVQQSLAGVLTLPVERGLVAPCGFLAISEGALIAPLPLGTVETTWSAPLSLPVEAGLVAPCALATVAEAELLAPLPLGTVETTWSAPLSLPVESNLVAPCGLATVVEASLVAPLPLGTVESGLTAPLALPVESNLLAPCGLATVAEAQLLAPLPLGTVETTWSAPLALPVEAGLIAPCALATVAEAGLVAPLPLGTVETTWSAPLALPVEAGLVAPCGLMTPAEAQLIAPLPLYVTAEAQLIATCGLSDSTEAERALGVPLPLYGPLTEVLSGEARLLLAGQTPVDLAEATVSADEGSPYWQAELTLADANDYGRLPLDTAATLDLFGSTWSVVVRGREVQRELDAEGNERLTARITALSPAFRLSAEFAAGITQTWTAPVTARAAVEELVGAAVDWRTVNWTIPAYRLAALDSAPLEIAQRIVEAVGGLLESAPDGTLIARPLWPVAVPSLAAASPDHEIREERLFIATEQATRTRPVNRLRIVDVEVGFQDQIEFEPDEADGWRGLIRAYPAPWRTVRVVHTRGPVLGLYADGEVIEQRTETIEFVAGRGSIRYPLHALVSVTWLAVDLGGVATLGGARELVADVADGYSLALVTYTTRFLQYRAVSSVDTEAQFLLEDFSDG